MTPRTLARAERVNEKNAARPLRRCADCVLDISPLYTFEAMGRCPLFGFNRRDAELRCPSFEAKP